VLHQVVGVGEGVEDGVAVPVGVADGATVVFVLVDVADGDGATVVFVDVAVAVEVATLPVAR